jgi:hypothetical protein
MIMTILLTFAKGFIIFGLVLAVFAVFFSGPGSLTLFLSFGQFSLIIGIVLYLTVVIRDMKERRLL